MSKLNVLVVSKLDLEKGYLEDIAAIDPRISVKDGTAKFVTELRRKGTKGILVDRLEDQARRSRDWVPEPQEDFNSLLAEAEVIFGVLMFPEHLLARAPRLKWVHLGSAGIDRYVSTSDFVGKVTITNSRGAIAAPIAEHVLAFMFMLARNAPRLLGNKRNRRWERFATMELCNRTVGIIGLGAVGGEVARLARGVGMRVIATRRSTVRRETGVDGVDEMYPHSDFRQMIHDSDFLVVTAPLTAETKGMIGETELRAMKPTAYLINVARGTIVNQTALIRALKEGWIAGAGLDVFETEPLPPENELWELSNVILSSHMAGVTDTGAASESSVCSVTT